MAGVQRHTFLFADLVGFTALTGLHGDEAAADLAIRFADAVAAMAPEHEAELVRSIGDAVMVRGDNAAEMIRLGLRIHEELGAEDGFPPIHAGLDTGPAVGRRGDWFGATVNVAARVTDSARPGETLITDSTAAAACEDLDGFELRSLGPQMFKNVLSPTVVYAVEPAREPVAEVHPLPPLRVPARQTGTGFQPVPAFAGD